MKIDQLQTPCYVIDEKKMRENLEILKKVQEDTGCKILLAQKAFSTYALYQLNGQYISGTTARMHSTTPRIVQREAVGS